MRVKPWHMAAVECIVAESAWFVKDTVRKGRKTENYVIPTPEFMAIKDKIVDTAELFSPIAYPMLIEPNDWEPDRPGGYLLNEVMLGHDMVRRGNRVTYTGRNTLSNS